MRVAAAGNAGERGAAREYARAGGGGPSSNRGVDGSGGQEGSRAGEHGDRNLDSDGVDVVAGEIVRSDVGVVVGIRGCRENTPACCVAEIVGVELSTSVRVIRFVGGSGEDANAVGESVNTLCGERRVIRHSARANVGRHREEGGASFIGERGGYPALHHGNRIVLTQIRARSARAVQSGDGWRDDRCAGRDGGGGVCWGVDAIAGAQEPGVRARIADFRGELELERNIGEGVVVIVDVDRVLHAGIERKVQRPVARLQKGVHVHDERHLGGIVVAHERKKTGDIRRVVQRRARRAAVVTAISYGREA